MIKKLLAATQVRQTGQLYMDLIVANSMDIMQNQYGNYAITEILSQWSTQDCAPIYKIVLQRL